MAIKDIAIFAGSFDPITLGHLAVIKRALKDFKKIIVLVAINEKKKAYYSLKKRVALAKLATKDIKGVTVDLNKGLTVNYAKRHHVKYLIRGVRNKEDEVYEKKLKAINHKLNPSITTIIYRVSKKYQNISSHQVIALIKKGEDVSPFVSKIIIKKL